MKKKDTKPPPEPTETMTLSLEGLHAFCNSMKADMDGYKARGCIGFPNFLHLTAHMEDQNKVSLKMETHVNDAKLVFAGMYGRAIEAAKKAMWEPEEGLVRRERLRREKEAKRER